MSISSSWDLASDAELITAVRSGETAAFGVLYERHASAARAVAHQYSNSTADADDAVADAFHRVFSTIQGGSGPDVAFRAYLFTVVRRVAMGRVQSGRRVQATDDLETFESAFGPGEATEEPTFAGFERGVVSRAYKSLPERWQAVLWYTEVERLAPAEIAPVLGLTANGVAALAYRAREGLRQAYLQQHLASPTSEACTIVNGKLGAYVRGGLAKRETALVESHLDECGDCRALVLELGDVNHGMRAIIAPLVLGGVALSVLQGLGFGGAAGAIAAAGAGAGGAAGAGTGAGGAGAGAGGGVSVGAGAGTGAGTAGAGAAGAGAGVGASTTAGAGTLVGAGAGAGAAGAGIGLGAAASTAVAVGGAATLTAALEAQPAAASTMAGGAAGTTGAGAAGAGAAGAGALGGAAATTGGLAALVASVPVTAIGLAAAGVIVAGAIGVAGAMGVFSTDDGDPEVVAEAPDIEELTPTPPVDPTAEPTDEPTTTSDEPSTDPTNPANVPVVDDSADDPEPTTPPTTPPTTEPTTPPTTPPPTTPPTDPPVDPAAPPVLVAQPPTIGSAGFVAGEPALLQVPVQNSGGDAGEVSTQLVFPTGTVVDVEAVDPPAGGGTSVRTASNGWSCSAVGEVATCTLPSLGARGSSTLYAHVTVLDDEVDGIRTMTVGVRTWATGQGSVPAPTPVNLQVSSPPTSFTVAPIATAVLKGDNDTTATTPVSVRVTNSGTHAPGFLRLSGIPSDVSVTPSAGWTCTPGIGLECTGPDIPRGAYKDLVLTIADTTPVVDVDRAGFVTVSAIPGNGESFSLTTVSAPARYAVDVEQLTTAPGSTLDTYVTVTNTGRTTGREVLVALDLPQGLAVAGNQSWAPCTTGAGDVCRTFPALAPGAALENLHVSFKAAVGSYQLTVTVADGAGANASASASIEVGAPPAVVGVSGPAEIVLERGVPATLSTTVTNSGGSTATGVVLHADLPQGVSLLSDTGCVSRNGSNRLVECTVDNLAAGASRTVTFQVLTNGVGAAGDVVVLTALWDVPGSTEDAVSEPLRVPVRVIAEAPVVRASLDPETTFVQGTPRDVVATVTNSGTTTATGLTATFQLPTETFWERTANGSEWTCDFDRLARTVTCTTPSLAAGASVELAGSIRANTDQAGRIITLGLTWTGGAAPAVPTTVLIVPACEPAWTPGHVYSTGDLVSYEFLNYTRLRSLGVGAFYKPSDAPTLWRSVGPCA